jgi:hypothetical protein
VPLAEDNDMIKTFPSDRANQPFRMAILPRRVWRSWPVANAHRAKPPFEYLAVGAISIADDVARPAFPAAGLGKLPGNPFGARVPSLQAIRFGAGRVILSGVSAFETILAG